MHFPTVVAFASKQMHQTLVVVDFEVGIYSNYDQQELLVLNSVAVVARVSWALHSNSSFLDSLPDHKLALQIPSDVLHTLKKDRKNVPVAKTVDAPIRQNTDDLEDVAEEGFRGLCRHGCPFLRQSQKDDHGSHSKNLNFQMFHSDVPGALENHAPLREDFRRYTYHHNHRGEEVRVGHHGDPHIAHKEASQDRSYKDLDHFRPFPYTLGTSDWGASVLNHTNRRQGFLDCFQLHLLFAALYFDRPEQETLLWPSCDFSYLRSQKSTNPHHKLVSFSYVKLLSRVHHNTSSRIFF